MQTWDYGDNLKHVYHQEQDLLNKKINLITKTPEIEELITSLLDPHEYFDSEYNLLDIVNFLNNYLRFDDYEIVDHDGYYKIYDRRKPANTPKIFKGEVKTCRLAPSGRSNIITMSNNEVFYTNIDELFEPGISIFAEALLYKNTENYFSGHYEVRKVPNEDIHVNDPLERKEVGMDKVDKVFIIHGHDSEMKTNVQLLLSRAKVTDVVLHECADKGRNIIDKLIEETYGATYAIALLSPDDKLEDGSIRARKNVILEIGFFLGRLGKQNVRLLVKDERSRYK